MSKEKITKGRMSNSKASAPVELIQVDIGGAFRYNDYVDTKYFLTITDKFSSYYDAILLKAKSLATIELINWNSRAENHFANHGGYKVSHVRTDNDGEFIGEILHNFFAERGITHELTVPHPSSQNDAVEHAHFYDLKDVVE